MTELDLSDPLVRAMADRNHVPIEDPDLAGRLTVLCDACRQPWPCTVRLRLRRRCDCSCHACCIPPDESCDDCKDSHDA